MLVAEEIKQHIYENSMIEPILDELGMHHIKWHSNNSYVTCGVPNGDNPHSTTVYNNNFLNVVAYTRDIIDSNGISDIISLVMYIRKYNFRQSLQWICRIVGLTEVDTEDMKKQKNSADIISEIKKLYEKYRENEQPLQPIDENNLVPYHKMSFQQFYDDNISDETQIEFELGLDLSLDYNGFPRHRIAIPIRDETGALVGIKGRILNNVYFHGKCIDKIREEENEPKYIYMYPCEKSKVLYGLYKTKPYIQNKKEVIICESEKGVMQLWSYGFKNGVGIGGHSLSISQIKKLLKLNVDITIAFDKDVAESEILQECMKLSKNKNKIFYIYDTSDLLESKESPMDNPKKWKKLYASKQLFIPSEFLANEKVKLPILENEKR